MRIKQKIKCKGWKLNKTYKYIDTIVAERQQVLQNAFSPLVLYNLNILHDVYMQTHFKYIVGHQNIKKICFALWKPMAFFGKLISKNNLND